MCPVHDHMKSLTNRLTIKLLDYHTGETGWDIFCLDYYVEENEPLKAVFYPTINKSYLRLFQFLWRAKRMEYIVTKLWTNLSNETKLSTKNDILPEVAILLHHCQLVLAEMSFYINQIQYYGEDFKKYSNLGCQINYFFKNSLR